MSVHKKSMKIGMATHKKEINENLDFFFLTDLEKHESQTEFALVRLGKKVVWEVQWYTRSRNFRPKPKVFSFRLSVSAAESKG